MLCLLIPKTSLGHSYPIEICSERNVFRSIHLPAQLRKNELHMWMTGIKFQPDTRISHCHYNEPCITREYHYSPHSLSSPLAPCYTRCNPNTRFIARSSFLEVVAPLLGGSPFRARVGVPTAFRIFSFAEEPSSTN